MYCDGLEVDGKAEREEFRTLSRFKGFGTRLARGFGTLDPIRKGLFSRPKAKISRDTTRDESNTIASTYRHYGESEDLEGRWQRSEQSSA